MFDKIGPFSVPDFDMTWFAINIDIIRKIGNEVAMPMRRFDSVLDYILHSTFAILLSIWDMMALDIKVPCQRAELIMLSLMKRSLNVLM